jgi:diguanylate cyclase (GGDEF)-like protein
MFDLDKFKRINDEHGHATGDAVIRKFCEVTAAALRPDDVFGRLGGEEFAVVLPWSSIEPAFVRANRIRASFAESHWIVGDNQVNVTVSAGVSVSVHGDMTLSSLLQNADKALYAAKASGRNRIERFDRLDSKSAQSGVIRVA